MLRTVIGAPRGKGASQQLTILAAFAAIYLIWGSTYLAIVFAIESLPPLVMMGARFGVAGLLVLAWSRWRGTPNATATEWRNAALIGTLALGVGTGSVAWAEQWVPSGVAALLVSTVPLWMVLIEWRLKGGKRPNVYVAWGLVLGLVGVLLLMRPDAAALSGGKSIVGSLAILVGAISFSFGAVLGRDMKLPKDAWMSTATQMIGGGVALMLAAALKGEFAELELASVRVESWLALLYLMVLGSIVAYGSFVWLMQHVSPATVSTYAYVNPIVAVFLGWLLAGEVLDGRVVIAVVILVSAVVLITRFGGPSRRPNPGRKRLTSRGVLLALAHSMDRPATSLSTGQSRAFEQARR